MSTPGHVYAFGKPVKKPWRTKQSPCVLECHCGFEADGETWAEAGAAFDGHFAEVAHEESRKHESEKGATDGITAEST